MGQQGEVTGNEVWLSSSFDFISFIQRYQERAADSTKIYKGGFGIFSCSSILMFISLR